MTEPANPVHVAARVARILDGLGIAHTIGGSIASSAAGEPRSTVDIDFVVAIELPDVPAFVAALGDDFHVDTSALERAVRQHSTVNIIDQSTQLKVDIFVAGGTPLDRQQIARRLPMEIAGTTLHIHPPEDILLQKLRCFRQGDEISDRQWRDITGITRVQGARLDRSYLAENAPVLGVADLLQRASAEGQRPHSAG